MDLSEPKLISPMLDNFAMGDPISSHHGVRCCPAMASNSDKKYIVKIISIPASQVQLDALLLTGAYHSSAEALSYFRSLSEDVVKEAETLQKLSQMEGFVSYEDWQIVPMENEIGYDVYLLGGYHRTLERFFRRNSMTHLGAVNLGLDLCAAMAVARKAGWMYVDLKPGNIFISEDQEYRVGDLGFISLDSLKYASLPDKYRSQYTAPEVKDAYASLNTTMDIYAIGMILYQAFNANALPFDGQAPSDPLPSPAYADYEMAEIIMKAIAPKPEDRWQDPVEMGEALVSYMQRNGANDTPITAAPVRPSVPVVQEAVEPTVEETQVIPEDFQNHEADAAEETDPTEPYVAAPTIRIPDPGEDASLADEILRSVSETVEDAYEDSQPADPDTDLSFLDEMASDETAPSEEYAADIEYHEVSGDLSDILNQADDLIAHEAPAPAVAPEPIEVTFPTPEPEEEPQPEPPEEEPAADLSETAKLILDIKETAPEVSDETPAPSIKEPPVQQEKPPKKKRSFKGLIAALIVVTVLALVAVGGYFFYQNYYLQFIDELTLEGTETQLTVYITSDADPSVLRVVCVDTFGNKQEAAVLDGKAVFDELNPNTIYKVNVEIDGFHKLMGSTSGSYTTPPQTNILEFNAIAGSTDGSVVLTITVEGQKSDSWNIVYGADGIEEKTTSFSGNMVTINGLTTGIPYTFTLTSDSPLYITGNDQITYTPTPLVYAENLEIISCKNSVLEVQWDAPEGIEVENWTVRCYNDKGFDQTIIIEDTYAAFSGVDATAANTVEVIAAGMSIGRQAYMTADSVTIINVQTEVTKVGDLVITWDSDSPVPEDGWMIMCTIDDSEHQQIIYSSENALYIEPALPGSTYYFTIQSSEAATIFGGDFYAEVPEADVFDSAWYHMSADEISYEMLRTPEIDGWDEYDVSSEDYTTTFSVGEKASFLLNCSHIDYSATAEPVYIALIIRDADGNPVSTFSETRRWYGETWQNATSTIDIPALPSTPGEYSISVYYDGDIVFTQEFTMVS